MAGTVSPIKKSRPRFKLDQFRDVAIESKGMEVGVDLELTAGTHDVWGKDPETGEPVVVETVTVADGDLVHVPNPIMLTDDRQDAFDEFQRGEDLDQVEYIDTETGETKTRPKLPRTIDGAPAPGETYRMACAIIGEHDVRRLLAGGGHSNDVALAWQYLTRDTRLDKEGPKAPKPSR